MFRFRFYRDFSLVFIAAATFVVSRVSPQTKAQFHPEARTQPGIDVVEGANPNLLLGRRIGVITNQTGVDSRGVRTIDILARWKGSKLVAIFSPEHGIAGRVDAPVANATDAATGVAIYSLYGETRRPTDAMLKGIDVLIFDIQDAGVRFYTYVTTMAYCMEEAAKHHIEFIVLDRPDPLGGDVIEGPMLDRDRLSFTGYFPMPVRYGMTIGELAQMFNAENKMGADLKVLTMRDWRRSETYDQTGLKWIPPSPNLRTVNEAFLYPGVEILQAGGVSVGRGTDTPFELIGAPWIHGPELAAELSRRSMPGVKFQATLFTPDDGPYKGVYCQGVSIGITDRSTLDSMRMGLEIADALHRLYPREFQLEKINELLGSRATMEQLERGVEPARIVASWRGDLEKFRAMREKYLLYH
jgi:uncharacterized protein YbbC (DUF1343 family)